MSWGLNEVKLLVYEEKKNSIRIHSSFTKAAHPQGCK